MNNLTPVTHGLISKSQKVSLHSKHNDFTFGNKIPFIDLINYVKEDICMLQSLINTPPPQNVHLPQIPWHKLSVCVTDSK